MNANKQKRTGGFTLIELIVVIAILGILAGVGTVAYTGYVKAAHKGVDEQLISDVAYSMYLASYADPNFLGDYNGYTVSLEYNEDPGLAAVAGDIATKDDVNVTKLKSALEMSFGSNCTENGSLELTYDGWKLGPSAPIFGSSYNGKEEQLLADIQTFTDSLKNFFGDGSEDSRLYQVLNSNNSDYAKYLNSMNATSSQEAANATTLYLAQYATNKSNPDEYAQWWASGFDPNSIPEEIAEAAAKFNDPDSYNSEEAYDATGDIMMFYAAKVAAAEAAYQYVTKEEGEDAELTEKFNAIRSANGLSALMQATTDFNSVIKAKSSYQEWCNSQAEQDAKAYIQCLNAINESSDSFTGNLSQQNTWTDGKALGLTNAFKTENMARNILGLNDNDPAVTITIYKDSDGKIMVMVRKNGEATAVDNGSGDGSDSSSQVTAQWNVIVDGEVGFVGSATPTSCTLGVGGTLVVNGTLTKGNAGEYALEDICEILDDGGAFSLNNPADISYSYSHVGDTITITITVVFSEEGTYTFDSGNGPQMTIFVIGQ